VPLRELSITSNGVRACLRLNLEFRRECTKWTASYPGEPEAEAASSAADIVRVQFAKIPATDVAAFKVYLESSGARDVQKVLGDAYLKTRADRAERVRQLVGDAVGRFARKKIGRDTESTLQRVVALVDDGESLEETRIVLHLLRSVLPKDPRVPVELARVAIKQPPASFNNPGEPVSIPLEFLDDAQGWMDIALGLGPRRADTLVLAGHLAYLKRDYPKSIAMLEDARKIGTSNPWLRMNLADVLWASARANNMDRALLSRAATEYEASFTKDASGRVHRQALHNLAHLYGDMQDFPKARARFHQLIAESPDYAKSEPIADFASYLFFTEGDIDGAITTGRQALTFGEVDLQSSVLAEALLIKAGKLYVSGKSKEAARMVKEAQGIQSGLERRSVEFAQMPLTFPAVFALRESGLVDSLSNSDGGATLVLASAYATAAEIDRLVKYGADPNYLDPTEGTPLHMAVRAGNPEAIRALLAHGANGNTRGPAGTVPIELAEQLAAQSSPKGTQVLSILRAAGLRRPAAAGSGPLKVGYLYQVLKPVGGSGFGDEVGVGEKFVFLRSCSYTDPALACIGVRFPARNNQFGDVALEKEQLVFWNQWFKEIGPAGSPK